MFNFLMFSLRSCVLSDLLRPTLKRDNCSVILSILLPYFRLESGEVSQQRIESSLVKASLALGLSCRNLAKLANTSLVAFQS